MPDNSNSAGCPPTGGNNPSDNEADEFMHLMIPVASVFFKCMELLIEFSPVQIHIVHSAISL